MPKPVVLIVEDDFMIADCLEEILVAAGFTVCGIAGTTAEAIALGERHNPDLGIIDLRLADGGIGTDVAAALCTRSKFGVLYVSGNPDHPRLQNAEGNACIGVRIRRGPPTWSARDLSLILRTFFRASVRTGSGVAHGDHQRSRAPAPMA